MAASVSQLNTLIPSGGVYEAVDLGLPSGTKWAKFNIGATSETDYGDLFAWGATTHYNKDVHNTNDYSSSKASTIQHNLLPYEDAATIQWGAGWCMPTKAQCEELIANTTIENVTINDVVGVKCTSSNGNYIFLPFAGYATGSTIGLVGISGYFWCTNFYSSTKAYRALFRGSEFIVGTDNRNYGIAIRPVKV